MERVRFLHKLFALPALAIALCFVVPLGAQADDGANLEYMLIARDPGFKAVSSSSDFNERFLSSRRMALNFGVVEEVFWGRLKISNDSNRDSERFIEIAYPALDMVDLYIPEGSGHVVKRAGDRRSFYSRDVAHRHHIFRVPLAAGEKKTVYLRVRTNSNMQIPVIVHRSDEFHARDHNEQYILGIYYGIMLVMALYNFFLFVTIRDRNYLYYVLYTLAFIFGQLSFQGFAIEYLWPEGGEWNDRSIPSLIGLTFVFLILFTRSFLNLGRYAPRTDLFLRVLLISISVYVLAAVFLPAGSMLVRVGNFFILSITSGCLLAGAVRAIQGYRPALYYLFAWFLLMIFTILLGLKNIGILPSMFLTNYGVYIGSALEVVLLSFALADRINLLKQEKEAAQSEAIENKELALENLRHADKLKDEFLANTSHELRTPLNGIIGIAESLNAGVAGKLNDEARENLTMIAASGRRLFSLVSDILDFSRMRNREMAVREGIVSMRDVAEVVVVLTRPLLGDKNCRLINDIPADLPHAQGDENRLKQILHNLIDNAVKFTKEGAIYLEGRMREDMIEIEVRDTGIGIPRESLEEIFESFRQADASVEREYGGAGLGLSITRKLVELHNGRLRVESEVGKGSSFFFTLRPAKEVENQGPVPLFSEGEAAPPIDVEADGADDVKVDAKPEEVEQHKKTELEEQEEAIAAAVPPVIAPVRESTSEDADDAPGEGPAIPHRILIVDDEPVNLRVLRNFLELADYEVVSAARGAEALEIVHGKANLDLVLLDVMMPGMSGFDVCRGIRESYSASQLPVILLTAKDQVKDVTAGFASGANDYLTKPFSREELYSRIQSHLHLKKSNEELLELKNSLEVQVFERTRDLNQSLTTLRERDRILNMELNMAARIQEGFMPRTPLDFAGWRIISCHFFKEKVGGDFFDIIPMGGGDQAVLIADVSGHGIPAALITVAAKISFMDAVTRYGSVTRVLAEVNRTLRNILKTEEFLTALFMIVRTSGEIVFGNAGHPLPMVLRRGSDKVERWGKPGIFLGVLDNDRVVYNETRNHLNPGDRMLVYTDGVVDSLGAGGDEFGEDRLKELFIAHRELSLEDAREGIAGNWRDYVGAEGDDDATFLIVEARDQ